MRLSCGADVMAHVYTPDRLEVLSPCLTVAGTIDSVHVEADGDEHVLVNLDAGQTCAGRDCLNDGNRAHLLGDLLVEVVCAHSTSDPAAAAACRGYQNTVSVPSVGSHVTVTGPWVLDTNSGWNEIHPVVRFGG